MDTPSTARFVADTLAQAIEASDRDQPVLEPVARALGQRLGSRTIGVTRLDLRTDDLTVEVLDGEPLPDLDLLRWAARARPGTHPLLRHWLGGGARTAVVSALVRDDGTWVGSETRAILREGMGCTETAGVLLSLDASGATMLGLAREEDYAPDHLEILRLLEPGLLALFAHEQRAAAAHGDAAARARRARAVAAGLTAREVDVLDLLALGLPAVLIGRRLGISVRTVHRHLSSVYAKLGTHDRLTTVLVAGAADLLPPAGDGPAQKYPSPRRARPPHTQGADGPGSPLTS